MPLLDTTGNNTADAYGAGVAAIPNYIENVFSTYLYTGTGASQSIVNGIDLSTKGGLVWLKPRSSTTYQDNLLFDTVRGANHFLFSNSTMAEFVVGNNLTAFNANGFDLGSSTRINASGVSNVSWTFRKQPKFFDVVTYTGTGSNTTVAHNLGSVPGCIIVKRTDTAGDWQVYHNSLTSAAYSIQLDLTNAQASTPTVWNSTAPTSTVFSVGTNADVNASGGTYVAYIFAHNAGGFGLTGTDNVISCGSVVGASGASVNLGYEPQWILAKNTTSASEWALIDTMRGWNVAPGSASTQILELQAQSSAAEVGNGNSTPQFFPTATGFNFGTWGAPDTWIYIAIRRGPMKVPTDATKVFLPSTFVGSNSVNKSISTNFTVDMTWGRARNASVSMEVFDRLRGAPPRLVTDSAAAEVSAQASNFDVNNGITLLAGYDLNYSTLNFVNYTFGRAPNFFDEVCYTGNSVAGRTITHNLGVTPEIVLIKNRGDSRDWILGTPSVGWTKYLQINQQDAPIVDSTIWNNTAPTSSAFTIGDDVRVNTSYNYVAYLFATCAGVSKVGTYTGNGTTQTINCGFTSGARFVLIRQTNTTGDWYVYDTARGMTTLTDPYLFTNTTAAETATLGSVTTVSTGFALNSSIVSAINVSGGSYIFLAIA